MNKVILIGRLCADPEFRQTTSGIAVCRIRLAVDRPKQKDQEQQADFVNCTAWRNTAEFISRYFTKGQKIIVEGSLRNNDYTDNNGVKHYSMEVQIQNVEFGESKGSDGGYQQQSAPAQQTTAPRTASPAQSPVEQQLDLSDFEEILSDGEVPF
jgi:single-strand DNA-binding protein